MVRGIACSTCVITISESSSTNNSSKAHFLFGGSCGIWTSGAEDGPGAGPVTSSVGSCFT